MNSEDKLKVLARLDGYVDFDNLLWCDADPLPAWVGRVLHGAKPGEDWVRVPPYLTDYNTIIPLVQKQPFEVRFKAFEMFRSNYPNVSAEHICDALIKAIGKWKD